jgi:plastocyanin
MKRLVVLPLAAAVLAAGATAVPASAAPAPSGEASATRTVQLRDSFFRPGSLSVRRGTRVRFVWAGRLPHNLIGPGAPRNYRTPRVRHRTLTLRYARKGTFRYVCTIHPGMRATIRVR